MRVCKFLLTCSIGLLAAAFGPTVALAQAPSPLQPVPQVIPPPQPFKTAEEHYKFLKRMNTDGTRHTYESVPHWEGLWSSSYNSINAQGTFVEGAVGLSASGTVKEGVLTPAYEKAYKARRDNMKKYNEQPFDRLTFCEAPGPARWLQEPYVREFVNTPTQSWWMNDLANETRRIYVGQDHKNIDGQHSPDGDSIGFWAGDKLVVWTKDMWPADWFRGLPVFSNEMQMIEVVYMETTNNGLPRLIDQVTFYDPVALVKPISAVYSWQRAYKEEDAGYRIRHWECDSQIQQQDGNLTTIRLPGEGGKSWLQRRAPDIPADLPGQTKTPGEVDFDTVFDQKSGK
jgi:hypothetical protein